MDSRGDFNMTERPQDKSNDYGRAISDLERFTWNELLNALQVNDKFIYQGESKYSWTNGQKGQAKRLARLDRFYTPSNSNMDIKQMAYYIHGYSMGLDHSPVQMEICIGSGEVRRAAFKWNVSYMEGEFATQLKEKWASLPIDASFFQKLRQITRLYRQFSKHKAKEHKREELNARANIEIATAKLHEDIYNVDL